MLEILSTTNKNHQEILKEYSHLIKEGKKVKVQTNYSTKIYLRNNDKFEIVK